MMHLELHFKTRVNTGNASNTLCLSCHLIEGLLSLAHLLGLVAVLAVCVCVAVGVSSVPNEAVASKGILTHHFESFVDASLGNKVKRLCVAA